MIGSGDAVVFGETMTAWSVTPSRMPTDTSRRSQSSARVGSCAPGGMKAGIAGARSATAARANRQWSMTRTDGLLGVPRILSPWAPQDQSGFTVL
jgi:hypothetical protein